MEQLSAPGDTPHQHTWTPQTNPLSIAGKMLGSTEHQALQKLMSEGNRTDNPR